MTSRVKHSASHTGSVALSVSRPNFHLTFTFQRDEGRLELAHELDWPPFDEDEDMRTSIKLDTLYDSLMFCVNKGFRWEYIINITHMVLQVLEETPGK